MRIDARNPVALGMLVVGVMLMAATLIYSLAVKAPDAKTAIAKQESTAFNSKKAAKLDSESKATAVANTQARLWSDSDDVIAPKTLKILTDLAEKHGLKVSSFRPQKETVAGALTILPFFVSFDGPFPNFGDYLRDFEENQQLLIVNNVLIAASDQNTHAVTASIEVSAYIDPNRDAGKADVVSKTPPGASIKPSKSPSAKSATHSVRESPRSPAKA